MCYVTVKILHKNPAQRLSFVVYNPEKNFYSLQRGLKFHQKVFCSRSILLQFEKKKTSSWKLFKVVVVVVVVSEFVQCLWISRRSSTLLVIVACLTAPETWSQPVSGSNLVWTTCSNDAVRISVSRLQLYSLLREKLKAHVVDPPNMTVAYCLGINVL